MGSYSYTPTELYDQEIHTIHIPTPIRESGECPDEIIAEGAAFLHKDGIIVLENCIDISHIESLSSILLPVAQELAADPDHHWNFGTPNMDQAPPPTKELMYRDIWSNPFASAILSAVLGPKPQLHYANGNTALKADAGVRQPVHSDCEFQHPAYFPWAYVMNVYLCDATPENGSTEFWPGSQWCSLAEAHVDGDDPEHTLTIKKENLEARRLHSPPVQITAKKGSMVIRDLRLWHAGMPNLTETPRIMLAFVAQPRWFKGRSQVLLPRDVKEMVEGWEREENGMGICAQYVDEVVDYKKLSSAEIDFDTGSEVLNKYRDVLAKWPEYVPRWS
jgi:hypothetical protein